MQIKRHTGTGLVVVTLGLAALATGCGGSSSKATPIEAPTTVRTPKTLAPSTSDSKGKAGPTTTAKPTAAALAGLQQQLDQAGSALTSGDSAIAAADVNQAKGQEGSAP